MFSSRERIPVLFLSMDRWFIFCVYGGFVRCVLWRSGGSIKEGASGG